MSVEIDAKDVDASISVISGVSKKNNKQWFALRVVVGEWSQLIFAKSKFEMDYLIKCLGVES